jgi:hypothetical protein
MIPSRWAYITLHFAVVLSVSHKIAAVFYVIFIHACFNSGLRSRQYFWSPNNSVEQKILGNPGRFFLGLL